MEDRDRKSREVPAWARLKHWERCVVALTAVVVVVTGVRHLPLGVCFGDAGDLQCACATLGIAHPPGYVGYAAVGWVLCQVLPFVDPAYVVSLACLACIVISVALLHLLLVRFGLHVLVAAAVALILLAHKQVWESVTAPEVYAPSLAGLLGAAYLLVKYGRVH